MSKVINGGDLQIVVNSILNAYSDDIKETITKSAIDVAEEGRDKLRSSSPKRTGDYRRGWRIKKKIGNSFVHCTIHNATNYQLTHLLEKEHKARDGSIMKPKVHIQPVEEFVQKEYADRIEKAIKGGK